MKTIISPSLLSANFIDLKSDIEMINKSEADWLHLDVMDGVFVPNISFGFPVIEAVSKVCTKPLDVHFMIVHPEQYIEQTASGRNDDECALRGMHPPSPYHTADSCRWNESRCNAEPIHTCLRARRHYLRCGHGAADECESRLRRTAVH